MASQEPNHVTPEKGADAAESSEKQRGRPFAPGVSGNPAGRKPGVPNHATRELKAFCQGLIADEAYRLKFAEDFKARKVDPRLEQEVWNRAAGKVKQEVDVNASVTFAQLVSGLRPRPPGESAPDDEDDGG
jgi:hypothetical protein